MEREGGVCRHYSVDSAGPANACANSSLASNLGRDLKGINSYNDAEPFLYFSFGTVYDLVSEIGLMITWRRRRDCVVTNFMTKPK